MNTVQDIFFRFYSRYTYRVSRDQAKAASAILNCRTKALGGHVHKCKECGYSRIQYNSCRNRHCSMCQGVNKAVWIDQRNKDVLNAPYFHVVFTIPMQLHQILSMNQKLLYDLMYKAVAETLHNLSKDEKHLGAQIGFLSLLHTWGSDLHYHPHIHTVVMAGGITKLNKWRNTGKDFFIPVKVLSEIFRSKFLFYLKKYYRQGKLQFYTYASIYNEPKKFQELLDQCYKIDWYTYTQKTFSGPEAVIKYLGRYTNRIAISNSRIVSMDEETVTFTVKDYKKEGQSKNLTLSGNEFIRRFLYHVLPAKFVKIRYYGLLANVNKKTKLSLCRKLTYSPTYTPKYEGLSTMDVLCKLTGRDILLCPACKQAKLQKMLPVLNGALP